MSDYQKMKVTELRDELSILGLSTKGLKKDLLERLEQHHQDGSDAISPKSQDAHGDASSMDDETVEDSSAPDICDNKNVSSEEFDQGSTNETVPKKARLEPLSQEPDSIPDEPSSLESSDLQAQDNIETPNKPISTELTSFDEQVRPSRDDSSSTVLIEGLQRPYTNENLLEMIQESVPSSVLTNFWLNFKKSFCFATFENDSMASAVRAALNGKVWPESSNAKLEVSIIPLKEAIARVESYNENLPSSHLRGVFAEIIPQSHSNEERAQVGSVEEAKNYQDVSSKVELSLEDIFKKTKHEPSVYYIPNKPAPK